MLEGQASRTALGAASHRAAHQVLEHGRVLSDPLALRILGAHAEEAIAAAHVDGPRRTLRLFVAVRSRFSEDSLADAVARGASQLVVLGAGLDTLAYRTKLGDRLRMFEVDHPATQAWKRRLVADAGIAVPPALTYVPVDFEKEPLLDRLVASGFDPSKQTFFSWLGVTPYLTPDAVLSTLAIVAALPGGAHVVFDYADLAPAGDPGRATHDALAERVASIGEPFRSHFEPDTLGHELSALGFRDVEDLGPAEIAARWFGAAYPGSARGGHIVRASTHAPGV